MTTITEKWEKRGLLEYITEDRKEMTANTFEFTYNILIQKYENPKHDISQPFLIVARICRKIELSNDEVLEIINDVELVYKNFIENNKLECPLYDEAEFIATYVDEYLANHGYE